MVKGVVPTEGVRGVCGGQGRRWIALPPFTYEYLNVSYVFLQ